MRLVKSPLAGSGLAGPADREGDRSSGESLTAALLATLAYGDIFDYPLTLAELHRYLVGQTASPDQIASAVASARGVTTTGAWVMLADRPELAAIRRRRSQIAEQRWPQAVRYGRIIARLPFVRLVGLTGALAVGNVEPESDFDYFVVAETGRVWLCRLSILVLVHWAARRGEEICPNYVLAERALALPERNLFVAHEIAQMVPIAGFAVYQQLRQANRWTGEILPNADGPPRAPLPEQRPYRWSPIAEAAFRTPIGRQLERWEQQRKIAKLRRASGDLAEAAYGPDWCKGHVNGHGGKTLAAYQARLATALGAR